MGRRLIVSDVHGFYDEMVRALRKANYQPDSDELICIGDMINRGPRSSQVVKFMKHYASKVISGNHETGFPLWLLNQIPEEDFFGMGGDETVKSYISLKDGDERLAKDVEWILGLDMIYEDKDFIYVHSGLDYNRSLDAQKPEDVLWGAKRDFYKMKNKLNKTIIFGHVPVEHLYRWNKLNIQMDQAFNHNGIIGIDGGSIAGRYVFIYDADNNKTYSERVNWRSTK